MTRSPAGSEDPAELSRPRREHDHPEDRRQPTIRRVRATLTSLVRQRAIGFRPRSTRCMAYDEWTPVRFTFLMPRRRLFPSLEGQGELIELQLSIGIAPVDLMESPARLPSKRKKALAQPMNGRRGAFRTR